MIHNFNGFCDKIKFIFSLTNLCSENRVINS